MLVLTKPLGTQIAVNAFQWLDDVSPCIHGHVTQLSNSLHGHVTQLSNCMHGHVTQLSNSLIACMVM